MKCYLCRGSSVRLIKTIQKAKIYECIDCQLAIIYNPQQDKQRLERLYNFNSYEKNEERMIKRFIYIIENINKYKQSGRVLDIGVGFGLFSKILSESGNYKIDAIEPFNIPYYLKSSDVSIHTIVLEKFLSQTNHKYDIIVMIDILEHFKDPLEILKKIKLLMKEDGILVIQTPNYKSLMAKVSQNWSWWMIEDHKNIFSPRSLKILLNKANLNNSQLNTYEDNYEFMKNIHFSTSNILLNLIFKMRNLIIIVFYLLFKKLIHRFNYGGLMLCRVKYRV